MMIQSAPISEFLDKNKTRYRLFKKDIRENYNWIFVPGGPGADPTYFKDIIFPLDLPGNFWLLDFPENGDNLHFGSDYDFEKWTACFQDAVREFENPI